MKYVKLAPGKSPEGNAIEMSMMGGGQIKDLK